MKRLYFFLAAALLLSVNVYAQTGRDVHGTVIDTTKITLPGSTVKLIFANDSTSTVTDAKGAFLFPAVKSSQFTLVVQSIGYLDVRRHVTLDNTNNPVFFRPIVLKPSTTMLNGVVIRDALPVKVKEDTVEFNAAAYPVRDGAPIEDVIKKVPGADVDAQGNVTFQGKSVTKVRVNGKDFFGGDLKTATQNLPADAVQNVQFVNDYGDQANLTGIKTGEPETILNINIRPSRNHGIFGQASAGGGEDAIPQIDGTKDQSRYLLQGNMFDFDGDRQIAVLANYNNTNTNLFNFGGGPGGGGGGRGGGGPGGPPGGNNNTNGITTARSIGVNYRDSWSKKMTVYGSFSFSDNSVYTTYSTLQNNISLFGPSSNSANGTENDSKVNARFTFNMEYKPDTINYLKISPSYAFAGVHTTSFAITIYDTSQVVEQNYTTNTIAHSSAPTYGINVLYNHRFNSHGRNFSINVGVGRITNDQYTNPINNYIVGTPTVPNDQFITTNSNTDTLGTYVSYIEPLGKRSYMEVNYNYKNSYTTSDKETDTLATSGAVNRYDLLSNDYTYTFLANRFGLNYRFVEKKYNYVLGVTAQTADLSGSAVNIAPTDKNTFNFSPNAHFVYNFSRTQSFNVNYSGSSVMPTYTQLQPVTDYSNALYPVTGNPNLNPQYNNTVSIRYNNFNFTSGNVFFTNFSFTQASDYIASNSIYYPSNYTPNDRLSKTVATTYQNADGYYSTQAFFVFNKPWDKRKYNLFMVGNISYSNNISYITDVAPVTFAETTEKNVAKTLTAAPSLRFRLDITDVVDAQASATYTINSSQNSIPQQNIQDNFRSAALGLTGKNYFFKDWTYSYDYTKTFYYNYANAKNPNVFNTYIERRFLKGNMATLRFAVQDVFNQNTGFSSSQSGTMISQSNYNRLGRYYLLSFTYRFQKLAGKAPDRIPGRFGPPGGGPGPGGPPGGGGFPE